VEIPFFLFELILHANWLKFEEVVAAEKFWILLHNCLVQNFSAATSK